MKKVATGILSAIGMFLLIIDSKTAIASGKEGIQLCIQTVIPSLLPFFVISGFLCRNLAGISLPILRPVSRLCGIPAGTESLLLLGFLGGYPVGAQNIQECEKLGVLDKNAAKKMLGFCNNAGPAFIFGMAGSLFSGTYVPWALWLIHIASAVIVGILLPGRINGNCRPVKILEDTFIKDVEKSVKTMANVCCWVILFRVVISFCKRWFFWLFPVEAQVLLTGIAELANGVVDLTCIPYQGLRFVLCSVMLGFGGTCVAMQTVSITESLGTGYYFPGKLLQGFVSFLLSVLIQPILFSSTEIYTIPIALLVCAVAGIVVILLILHRNKNNSRIVAPCLI